MRQPRSQRSRNRPLRAVVSQSAIGDLGLPARASARSSPNSSSSGVGRERRTGCVSRPNSPSDTAGATGAAGSGVISRLNSCGPGCAKPGASGPRSLRCGGRRAAPDRPGGGGSAPAPASALLPLGGRRRSRRTPGVGAHRRREHVRDRAADGRDRHQRGDATGQRAGRGVHGWQPGDAGGSPRIRCSDRHPAVPPRTHCAGRRRGQCGRVQSPRSFPLVERVVHGGVDELPAELVRLRRERVAFALQDDPLEQRLPVGSIQPPGASREHAKDVLAMVVWALDGRNASSQCVACWRKLPIRRS